MLQDALDALDAHQIAHRRDAPLVKRTWWRAGGPADVFVNCTDLETVSAVQQIASQTDVPVFVLGNASNLLVADAGIRGIVVRLGGELAQIEATERVLDVGAGVKLMPLVNRMARNGWTGLEFLAGIPGTVGGAVKMNAGTYMGEVVDALIEVQVVLADGEVRWLPASALKLAYRHSELPPGAIVTRARLRLTDDEPAASKALIDEHLARRERTQPIDKLTCGSTFRNPPGDHAGRLIETCGLKGYRVGKAMVSDKHANFMVNEDGEATAADIRHLIEHVQREVEAQTGVRLVREVHFVGAW